MALVPLNQNLPVPVQAGLRSMLLIECGSTWTRASLLGMAEGHCRLLARTEAPTTSTAPQADINVGIRNVLTQLEYITGRRLIVQGTVLSPESEVGDGIDGMMLITSVGGPLRVMLLGPGLNLWGASLRRAFASLAVEAVRLDERQSTSPTAHVILLLGPGPEAIVSPEARMALEHAASVALAQVSTQSGLLTRPNAPTLAFLGSPPEYGVLRQLFVGRDVVMIEPPTPPQAGQIIPSLAQSYEQAILAPLPGYRQIQAWLPTAPISVATGLGRVVRFLSQRYVMNVLAVNVGATATLAVGANAQGHLFATQAHLLGVRQGAGEVARHAGLAAVARWLPFDMSEDDLHESILQRMLHPHMLPISPVDLAIDHALTREALRQIVAQGNAPGGIGEMPAVDVIVGSGGVLANAPKWGQAALMLLDAVQPQGFTSLVIDAAQIMTALGGASLLDRMAAADAVDMDAVQIQLGTCVATVGTPPEGEPALRVVLEYADGHRHTTEVLHGSIELLPLGVGQRARIMLYPAAGVDVGMGPGARAQAGQPIEGGRLGVIIDARGRPLTLPPEREQQQAKLRQWQAALGI